MTFREWLKSLEPDRRATPGEDFADSIGLMIIMALILAVVFM